LYFDVPPNPRLQNLVRDLTAGLTNNYDKVMALKAYIESNCTYNLNPPAVPMGRDAVDFFLFDSREGYCDLFSSALAVLVRYAGIPSRVATGFITGDQQPDGKYIAKEKHRHQWTEIYFPGWGWIAFDATEGAREVTEDRRRQGGSLSWQALVQRYGYLPWALLLGAIGLLLFAVVNEVLARRSGVSSASRIVRAYLRAVQLLQRAGVPRAEWMTPSEYAERVQKALPDAAVPVWGLTRLLERSEYGKGIDEAEVCEAERYLQQIRAVLKRQNRW
jgi:hypothetical protein